LVGILYAIIFCFVKKKEEGSEKPWKFWVGYYPWIPIGTPSLRRHKKGYSR
jgi:hypothetical protein